MKKLFLAFIFVILALFISGGAGAFTITDTGDTAYWGGSTSTPEDVIGDLGLFSIDRLDATQTGGTTTVVLTGPYFQNIHFTNQFPGDLYISTTGWQVDNTSGNPAGTLHYPNDTFVSTEGWNYVVTFNPPAIFLPDGTTVNPYYTTASTVTAYVYHLDFGAITMTQIWRTSQAWQGGYHNYDTPSGIGTATLDPTAGTLTLTFPDLPVPLESLGFHFTMECGNDVVEGGAPIPEPATMLLLGSGLIGLAGFARKKFRK